MTTLMPGPARAVRSLLQGLTWPHGVEAFRDAYRPAASAGRIDARVVAVTPRTDRAHSLLLNPERPMTFTPGQHVLLTTQVNGARHTRCYSLSDTPHRADGRLEVTIAHLPDGLVSSHLVGGIAVGDAVGLSVPQGHEFVLPGTRPDRLLLIGGGSGITPLRSMWRTMAAEGLGDRVTVLYYARTAADAIFADELADMSGAHVVVTREDGPGPRGRFTTDHLRALNIDPTTHETFVCGPVGLVEAVRSTWTEAGLADRLRTESFAPPVAPAADVDAEGLLTFAHSGVSAHNDGTTLLEQAEATGLTPESGCRMGICHTCTTTKHAGVVRDTRTGDCSTDGTEEVQLCVSVPVGDVALDL